MRLNEIEANPILRHTLEFSVQVAAYCDELEANKKFVVAKQLLRAATSIGANAMEAHEIRKAKLNFIHKNENRC